MSAPLPIVERLRDPEANTPKLDKAAMDAADTIEQLCEALEHAHAEFIRCAKLHRAKGTDEGDEKACHNASMAEECHRALAKARGEA